MQFSTDAADQVRWTPKLTQLAAALALAAIGLAAVPLDSAADAAPTEQTDSVRPNILWMTSEDHGPHMGCYGDPVARTPNVDQLAARGLRFTHVWACVPVCAPARTAIITGLYPSSSGALHMRSMVRLPEEMVLFPRLLQAAGYYCTNNSKEDYNVETGPDLWNESSPSAHWSRRQAEQPFFAVFNSTKSHESQIRTRPHTLITDPARVRVPAYHPDTPETRHDWAQYYDQVSAVDADAGRRLSELDEAGLADDTIVFYFADHGSGMPRGKRWPSNSGLHVPMVVYFPEKFRHLAPRDYRPGAVSDRLVSFVDLAPTVLSLAGIEPPAWMQGRAFAGEFESPPPEIVFGERGRMDERLDLVRSATDGRYVYLRNFLLHVSQGQHVAYQFETPTTRVWWELFQRGEATPAQSLFWQVPKPVEELYDLASDPDEVHNLAESDQHEPVLMRFREAQRQHALAIRDVCMIPEGELFSRCSGDTPYQMARDEQRYPLGDILDAAYRASNLDLAPGAEWNGLLQHRDNAVRYWATLGLLMRGNQVIADHQEALRQRLRDPSPHVRVVAAQALAQHGSADGRQAARAALSELLQSTESDGFVVASTMAAIEALGDGAGELRAAAVSIDLADLWPHQRYALFGEKLRDHLKAAAAGANEPSQPASR